MKDGYTGITSTKVDEYCKKGQKDLKIYFQNFEDSFRLRFMFIAAFQIMED